VFAEVDDALGQHLSRLMWQGPEGDLMLTENAQPAIMANSMAVFAARSGRSKRAGAVLQAAAFDRQGGHDPFRGDAKRVDLPEPHGLTGLHRLSEREGG